MTKELYRNKFKELRKKIDINLFSTKIVDYLINSDIYKQSKNIMIYMPLRYEYNLIPITERSKDKLYYIPKCIDGNINICSYNKEIDLKPSNLGVLEPYQINKFQDPKIIDLICIPCICCDMKKNRIGFGKGYYDRFLPKLKKECIKIIIASSLQVVDCLPIDVYDIQSDLILTENGFIK